MRHVVFVGLLAGVLWGCYERPDMLDEALAVDRIYPLGQRALVLQANPERAQLLDVSGDEPTRQVWPFACRVGPSLSEGESLVAVLCWGDAPTLRLLRLVEGETPARSRSWTWTRPWARATPSGACWTCVTATPRASWSGRASPTRAASRCWPSCWRPARWWRWTC